jgi:hypothetical protein
VHVGYVAALVFVDDGVSESALGGTVPPEGAEDLGGVRELRLMGWARGSYGCGGGLIGGFVGKGVCDLIDERLEAKDVLQKLAFVAFAVGHSASFVQLEQRIHKSALTLSQSMG